MQIKTQDKIVQNVLRKMDERSLIGQKKYGATMMQEIEGQKKLRDSKGYLVAKMYLCRDNFITLEETQFLLLTESYWEGLGVQLATLYNQVSPSSI